MSSPDRLQDVPRCAWCGRPIEFAPVGRLRRYCNHSCRQRAYEVRTAEARLRRDVDAGRVRQVPAQRVVEPTAQPGYPTMIDTGVSILEELAAQLRDGRIEPTNRSRIRSAVDLVYAALGAMDRRAPFVRSIDDRGAHGSTGSIPVHERMPAGVILMLVEQLAATSAGSGRPTTLIRLARELPIDVAALRVVLTKLVDVGVGRLQRPGVANVDPATIAEHARFILILNRHALADEDLGLANLILAKGARLYVDHSHPEYSNPARTRPGPFGDRQ
jgi:hypothetical protein